MHLCHIVFVLAHLRKTLCSDSCVGKAKGELLTVIVAEDLFHLCVRRGGHDGENAVDASDAPQPSSASLLAVVLQAARAWAGHEEVNKGRMVAFMHDGMPNLHAFMPVRFAPVPVLVVPCCPC